MTCLGSHCCGWHPRWYRHSRTGFSPVRNHGLEEAEVMKETEEDQGGLERVVRCAGWGSGSSALDWFSLGNSAGALGKPPPRATEAQCKHSLCREQGHLATVRLHLPSLFPTYLYSTPRWREEQSCQSSKAAWIRAAERRRAERRRTPASTLPSHRPRKEEIAGLAPPLSRRIGV